MGDHYDDWWSDLVERARRSNESGAPFPIGCLAHDGECDPYDLSCCPETDLLSRAVHAVTNGWEALGGDVDVQMVFEVVSGTFEVHVETDNPELYERVVYQYADCDLGGDIWSTALLAAYHYLRRDVMDRYFYEHPCGSR